MSEHVDQPPATCSSPKSFQARTAGTSLTSLASSADFSEPCSCSTCLDLERQAGATDTHSAGGAAWLQRLHELDIRPKLPFWISRFLGYRPDGVCRPIWALRWLETFHVPLTVEEYAASTISTIFGMICVIMINTMTPFASLPIPLTLGFVGALSIIMSLTPQSPAATPRNVIISHLFASVLATVIAEIFLDDGHPAIIVSDQMSKQTVWIWACVAVTLTMLFQKITNTIHPPAGGTALLGTIQPNLIKIGWRYVGFVMSSVAIMVGVALVFGNIGRRSYPAFWFTASNPPSKAAQSTKANMKVIDPSLSYPDSEGQSEMSYDSTKSSKSENESVTIEYDSEFDETASEKSPSEASNDEKYAALSKKSSRNVAHLKRPSST